MMELDDDQPKEELWKISKFIFDKVFKNNSENKLTTPYSKNFKLVVCILLRVLGQVHISA
jgi:hypothetical protein